MDYWLINPKSEGSGTDLSGESIDEVYMGWNKNDCPKFYDSVKAGDVIIVTELSHANTKLHYIGLAQSLDEKNQCWYLKHSTKEKNDEIKQIIRNNSSEFGGGNSPNPWGPTKSIIKLTSNPAEKKVKEILAAFFKEKIMKEKMEKYANLLKNTHNLILHGAPGTGKTHLAREIAAEMKAEVGFVQFHPSYDYTDFVEGLRPVNDGSNGQIGFERKDGVFKKFCERALKNLEDSKKFVAEKESKISTEDLLETFKRSLKEEKEIVVQSIRSPTKLTVFLDNDTIKVKIPKGTIYSTSPEKIRRYLKTQEYDEAHDTYEPAIGKYILDNDSCCTKNQELKDDFVTANLKPFVFIIDEINRGEMSKIFGELFFAIEPGYRGAEKCKDLRTQYANLQTIPNLFDVALGIKDSDNFGHFFIPENVYIIGTMNDIDRNVESMDFAFRRRFTFKEITAKETQEQIFSGLDDAIRDEAIFRMDSLNDAISNIEGLSSAYHIGGAYFLKLKDLNNDFGLLWEYHLEGLLREYLRGMEDADSKLSQLKEAYDCQKNEENS